MLGLAWPRLYPSTTPVVNPILSKTHYYVTDSTGAEELLTYQPVHRLQRKSSGLLVGDLVLPVAPDTVGKSSYWLPISVADWRRSFVNWLGGSGTDSAQRWQQARNQWQAFVKVQLDSLAANPDWQKLSPEQQLAQALLVKLDRNSGTTFLIDGSLQRVANVESISVNSTSALSVLHQPIALSVGTGCDWVFASLGLLTTLAGLALVFWKNRPPIEPDSPQLPILEENEELPTDVVDESTAEPEAERTQPDELTSIIPAEIAEREHLVIDQYLTNFYARYGDFYKVIQDIPIEPDEQDKRQIKRRLVEMGLHAHSLARAYKHNPALDRPADEPNLLLILENKQVGDLPAQAYKTFESGPYKSANNFQFLQQVLLSLDLGELEGALMQTIYLAPRYLKST